MLMGIIVLTIVLTGQLTHSLKKVHILYERKAVLQVLVRGHGLEAYLFPASEEKLFLEDGLKDTCMQSGF